jgi:molecular chaperone DnaJ
MAKNGDIVKVKLPGRATPLNVILRIEERSLKYKGPHVYSSVEINFLQAILGCKLNIEGLKSYMNIVVPPGTASNTELRLPRKGIQTMDVCYPGDHFVTVNVAVPKSITKKQEELLREFFEIEMKKRKYI